MSDSRESRSTGTAGGCPRSNPVGVGDSTLRGVAPVLGIVMMVAIAVSLAAVVAISAFGVADEVADVGPSTSFEYEYDWDGQTWESGDSITITHASGDEIRAERLTIEIEGAPALDGTDAFDDETVSAGSSATISHGFGEESGGTWTGGETIRLVWHGDAGETTVVSSRTIPG
ncbi:MAG: type IV pilin N-terminal domain-containing protein [Haloferacaceae archaeon]